VGVDDHGCADFNFTGSYFAPDWSRLKRGIDVSDTLARVQALARRGSVRISSHGYDELVGDDIFVEELLVAVNTAQVVEDYPMRRMGRAFWCCRRTAKAAQFMWFGVSRAVAWNLLHWSPLIVPTRVDGLLTL
jgi:hypothetical protein